MSKSHKSEMPHSWLTLSGHILSQTNLKGKLDLFTAQTSVLAKHLCDMALVLLIVQTAH